MGRHPKTIEEILAYTDKVGDCLLWRGATSNGYGRMARFGRRPYVHVVIWEHFNGVSVPDGYHVHHTCDTKLCCQPVHLKLLTLEDHGRLHGKGRPPKVYV